jgi:hypothetical protein
VSSFWGPLQRALENWHPVVEIDPDLSTIDETIQEFALVVDQIHDSEFSPPPVEKLEAPFTTGQNIRFATRVCRNCDARFSCAAYRIYARHGRGQTEKNFIQYYAEVEKGEPLEEWRTTNLDESLGTSELQSDYGSSFQS